MRILVDQQVWNCETLFGDLGEVRAMPGRAISRGDAAVSDVLIVRSVTRVDADLLGGTPVRFVGSATAGVDHVDVDWLAENGVAFGHAPGCNALPVAQYVAAALLEVAERRGFELRGRTLGVVGAGRIGSRVAEFGRVLGMKVLCNDPPLARQGKQGLVPIDELAARSDIVTLHVPLTDAVPDQTRDMADSRWLSRLRPEAILINTSRGQVVDEDALAAALANGSLGGAVLDVWRGEPQVRSSLVNLVDIATPHIAGYSGAAGRRAAAAVLRHLYSWLDRAPPGVDENLPAPGPPSSVGVVSASNDQETVCQAVRAALDLPALSRRFRAGLSGAASAKSFDTLRSECRHRLEFAALQVDRQAISISAHNILSGLGLRVVA